MYFALEERVIPSDSPLFQQVLTGKGVAEDEHVFLSLSKKGDTLRAPDGYRTLTCSTHVHLDGWNDDRKQVLKSKIRERVLTVFPRFEEGIVHELSGEPEAWEKFVVRREVGGFPQTKENTFFNAVSHRSGVDRL